MSGMMYDCTVPDCTVLITPEGTVPYRNRTEDEEHRAFTVLRVLVLVRVPYRNTARASSSTVRRRDRRDVIQLSTRASSYEQRVRVQYPALDQQEANLQDHHGHCCCLGQQHLLESQQDVLLSRI